jgi:hypothetical protein
MTENPVVVRAATDMTSAARMLLDTRVRTAPDLLGALHSI